MRKLIVFLAMIAVLFLMICPADAQQRCSGNSCTLQKQVTIEKNFSIQLVKVERKWNPADHPRDPVTGRFIKRAETTPTAPALCTPYKPHQPVRNALRAAGNGLKTVGKDLRAGLHFILVGPKRI